MSPPSVDAGPVPVAWLIKGLGPGGAEELLALQAEHHDPAAVRPHVVYLVPWKNQLVPRFEAAGVPAVCLSTGRVWDLRWLWSLRRFLARHDIAVLHGHSPLPAAGSRLLLRTLRPRPVSIYTEHNEWGRHSRWTRRLNRRTIGLEDHVVAVSAGVAATMATPAPVEVLHHGIDGAAVAAHRAGREAMRAALGIADHELVVGIVANLRREKAYEVLLAAASEVVARRDDVVFVSVGQGPLEAELREAHASSGLGDRFRFLGYRTDAVAVMATFDVFTLSSRHEGLPVAAMEALALGLPIVATAVGGLPELFGDTDPPGMLVPPDDPRRLADALLAVLDDAPRRAAFAAAATRRAGAFSVTAAVAQLEARYQSMTRGSSGTAGPPS